MNQEMADRIQRRRLQLLVHSRIYYKLNYNVVSDKCWDVWARELVELQRDYPEESEKTIWHEAFKDWDGSTGAFLPLDDPWVVMKVKQLYGLCELNSAKQVAKKSMKSNKKSMKKLF